MNTENSDLEYSLRVKDASEDTRGKFPQSYWGTTTTYEWAIDEVDENGKVVNEDQIPWRYSIYFEATTIRYGYDDREWFSVELKQTDHYRYRQRLEIFGASKPVELLLLNIYRASQKINNSESLRADAYIERKYESSTDIDPSYLEFELFLIDEKFDELKKLVIEKKASRINLSIEDCKGLYSGCHAGPTLNKNIKILTPDHEIELPEGCEDFLRIGNIERYTFGYTSEQKLASNSEIEEEVTEKQFDDEPVTTKEQHTQEKINSELQSINSMLNNAKYIAQAIITLLLLIWISS